LVRADGGDILSQILILLAGSVLVLTWCAVSHCRRSSATRGRHDLGHTRSARLRCRAVQLLAEIGVVFLVFTSPRILARPHDRDEARGAGHRQPADDRHDPAFGGAAWAFGIDPPSRSCSAARSRCRRRRSSCASSASSSRSTGRIPARGRHPAVPGSRLRAAPCARHLDRAATDVLNPAWLAGMVGPGGTGAADRAGPRPLAFRPLFREIARHRSSETFTLTVLFVALSSAGPRTRFACPWRSGRSSPACCSPRRVRHQTRP